MRCCPQPACGQMLHLPAQCLCALPTAPTGGSSAVKAPAAGAERRAAAGAGDDGTEAAAAAAVAEVAEEAGLDAECGSCGHRFCFQCGEGAHEPASCGQMRRWEGELVSLRRAAPSADRDWLSANTKRCPRCRAHIQKDGGCLHMTCRGCGLHFCWQCGREWSQHSVETGGFYFCSLTAEQGGTEELPEFSVAGSGGGGPTGPLAWVTGVWSSVKAAAQQHQLQRHLRQFLRHSGGAGALQSAAAHMQLLLSAAGMLGSGDDAQHSSGKGAGLAAATAGFAAAAAAAWPELLGVTATDASRMSSREWGDLVAAAAASAADAATPTVPSPLAVPAARAAAEASLAAAVSGPDSGPDSCNGSAASQADYLQQLAAAVVAAHSLLQHTAVALYLLPAGSTRRHLQQLSASMQWHMEQLEPLLLALPEREAVHTQGLGTQQRHSARQGSTGGIGGSSSGGSGGLTGWLLTWFYGIEPPAAAAARPSAPELHPSLAGGLLSGEVLLQQLHFAAAVHQQRAAVQARLRALKRDMQQMVSAARAGLYA